MFDLQFNQSWLIALAEYRSDFWTAVFQAITFMGGVEGYLLVIVLLYTTVNKHLAVRAAIVALITMIGNHLLKSIIQNPRPFTVDGSYTDMWAISGARATELAAEFSTPSGHAMAAAAFYAFLMSQVKGKAARALMFGAIVLIGLSRPILGVHYVEDILLGWLLGFGFAVLAYYRLNNAWHRWCSVTLGKRIAISIAVALFVWFATLLITNQDTSHLPTGFVSSLGFLTSVLVAAPIEARRIDYQPGRDAGLVNWASFALMMGILATALITLRWITVTMNIGEGVYGTLWRYLRYSFIGVTGMLVVPWLLVKLGLSQQALRPKIST